MRNAATIFIVSILLVPLALVSCSSIPVEEPTSTSKLAEAHRLMAQLPSPISLRSDAAADSKVRRQQSSSASNKKAASRTAANRATLRALMDAIEIGRNILDYPGLIAYGRTQLAGKSKDPYYSIRIGTGFVLLGELPESPPSSEFTIDFNFDGEIIDVSSSFGNF